MKEYGKAIGQFITCYFFNIMTVDSLLTKKLSLFIFLMMSCYPKETKWHSVDTIWWLKNGFHSILFVRMSSEFLYS